MKKYVFYYCFLFLFNSLLFSQNNSTNQIYFIIETSLWQNMDINNSIYNWEIMGERNFQMENKNNQYLFRYNENIIVIYSLEYIQTINNILLFEVVEIITSREYDRRVPLSKGNADIEEWIENGVIINDCEIYNGMMLLVARYISTDEKILKLLEF